MGENPRRPLPWEHKGAIGCLFFLSLQEVHEILLFCIRRNTLGAAHLNVLAPFLLTIFALIGVGLMQRSRKAWWCGLMVIGYFAFAHLVIFWNPIRTSLKPQPRIATVMESQWVKRLSFTPFGAFWAIARSVFLICCPALLLLGKLRKPQESG